MNMTVKQRRGMDGYNVVIGCDDHSSWERALNPQEPLWRIFALFSEHCVQRHGQDDDAIARAQAKTNYSKRVETLRLPEGFDG